MSTISDGSATVVRETAEEAVANLRVVLEQCALGRVRCHDHGDWWAHVAGVMADDAVQDQALRAAFPEPRPHKVAQSKQQTGSHR